MLSQQLSRNIARRAVARSPPGSNVCIFCRSAGAPDVLRRHYAKAPAPKAPSTRREQWRNKPRILTDQAKKDMQAAQARNSKLLPPFDMMKYLKEAGLVQADPENALALLDEMRELSSRLDGPSARKLCIDHRIPVDHMFFFARACLYSRNPAVVRKLGKKVMLAASANEIQPATLYLLRMAARQDELVFSRLHKAYDSDELALARRHLRWLVKAKSPEAVVFQAKRLAALGRTREAIAMLEDVLYNPGDVAPSHEDAETMHQQYSGHLFGDIENTRVESPWTILAQLHAQEGNTDETEAAYKLGAEKHDDPRAFQGLAADMKDRYSAKWVEYMTKAAASGSWTAARALGQFYNAPLEQIPEEELRHEMHHLEKNGHSVEWWYYYLPDEELQRLGKPPGTRLMGADFWRAYKDPNTDSALHMVELNPRQALAMEWYEVAWRGQYCFSDGSDDLINTAMQKIVDGVVSQKGSTGGSEVSWRAKQRHHDQHHWADEKQVFERASVEFQEMKKRWMD